MVDKSYEALIEALGIRESSGNYKEENDAGYLGKWQFGEGALVDIGYYDDGEWTINDWKDEYWKDESGVNSKKEFLERPDIQDKAILK